MQIGYQAQQRTEALTEQMRVQQREADGKIEVVRNEVEARAEMQQQSIELQKQEQERAEDRLRESNTLSARVKKYGDVLKQVLPHMPDDVAEVLAYWDSVDVIFSTYEVPAEIRAHLALPYLSAKAKSLMHRLTPDVVSDWEQLKDHLNVEFKITARECRARLRLLNASLMKLT